MMCVMIEKEKIYEEKICENEQKFKFVKGIKYKYCICLSSKSNAEYVTVCK